MKRRAAQGITFGLSQGCTFVNQYVVVKTLGQGAYGKVKLCLNSEDHNLYALKLVSKVGTVRTYLCFCPLFCDRLASLPFLEQAVDGGEH